MNQTNQAKADAAFKNLLQITEGEFAADVPTEQADNLGYAQAIANAKCPALEVILLMLEPVIDEARWKLKKMTKDNKGRFSLVLVLTARGPVIAVANETEMLLPQMILLAQYQDGKRVGFYYKE